MDFDEEIWCIKVAGIHEWVQFDMDINRNLDQAA